MAKKKWLKSNKGPVANIVLWKELSKEVHKCPLPVKIEWVKAHKSNIHNNAADKLAKKSAAKPFNKPFSQSATTKKWSPHSTKRGSIEMYAQEIIIRIISRKFIPQRGSSEYRYEVIDSDNKFFQYIDFIYCNKNLSRNKCYEVRFNNNQEIPEIDEVIAEIDCSKYKDSTD